MDSAIWDLEERTQKDFLRALTLKVDYPLISTEAGVLQCSSSEKDYKPTLLTEIP